MARSHMATHQKGQHTSRADCGGRIHRRSRSIPPPPTTPPPPQGGGGGWAGPGGGVGYGNRACVSYPPPPPPTSPPPRHRGVVSLAGPAAPSTSNVAIVCSISAHLARTSSSMFMLASRTTSWTPSAPSAFFPRLTMVLSRFPGHVFIVLNFVGGSLENCSPSCLLFHDSSTWFCEFPCRAGCVQSAMSDMILSLWCTLPGTR